MAKIYKTAKGKTVDLASLIAENEHTRAVGNMNVNARGDLLDSNNKKIQDRNQRLRTQYRRELSNRPVDEMVFSNKEEAKQHLTQSKNVKKEKTSKIYEEDTKVLVTSAPPVVNEPAIEENNSAPTANAAGGGLAAAIAKARQVKQEPLKSPRQQARDSSGVKKI